MQESQHLEFKRLWKDEYLKWICAFANTNGGTLMLGYNQGKRMKPPVMARHTGRFEIFNVHRLA